MRGAWRNLYRQTFPIPRNRQVPTHRGQVPHSWKQAAVPRVPSTFAGRGHAPGVAQVVCACMCRACNPWEFIAQLGAAFHLA
jgi:hypothetical protein